MDATVVVVMPRKLVEAIRRRGRVDIESFIIEAIERALNLDPAEEVETKIAVAKHMLMRAKEELRRNDAVPASGKLYKAVEECVKALACLEGLEECEAARREGQWWTKLLSRAARKLSALLNEPLILIAWSQAYDLHVHSFHEHGLDAVSVSSSLPVTEKLMLRNVLGRGLSVDSSFPGSYSSSRSPGLGS